MLTCWRWYEIKCKMSLHFVGLKRKINQDSVRSNNNYNVVSNISSDFNFPDLRSKEIPFYAIHYILIVTLGYSTVVVMYTKFGMKPPFELWMYKTVGSDTSFIRLNFVCKNVYSHSVWPLTCNSKCFSGLKKGEIPFSYADKNRLES